MVEVRFYGRLKQFGAKFQLDCRDTAEVLKALMSQIKGLRQHLQHGFYKVRIGSHYIDNRYLEKGLHYQLKAGMTVHITPVLKGAKRAGVFQTILGVALIAASFVIPPAGLLAGTITAGGLLGAGVAMTLGGVAQMLTRMPSMGNLGREAEKKSSSSFNGVQNRVAQGQPVPIAYGRILVGSMIISQGIETFDAETEKK